MAYKCREEIVGKRFLSVSGGFANVKSEKICEWGWRAGVIRAATHKDNQNADLQVLVEYDDVEWHRREWIHVYKDKLFHLFMVEQGLAWADRRDPFSPSNSAALWPALTFSPLVSAVEMKPQQQPVEFLLDRELAFADYKNLKPFQEWDSTLPGVRDYPELRVAVRRWAEQQDGQRILLTTPSVLVGYRVEVYRAEGTTQWYTAVIVGYNEATRDLTVTDDTVLEEHNEDPALVQMRLIGDGVVESIMRGENVGITPRRSRSTVLQTQHQQQPGRIVRGLSGVTSSAVAAFTRKPRSGKPTLLSLDAANNGGASPEPPDKGSLTRRKRKTSESESSSGKVRHNSFSKEDLENKQHSRSNNKRSVNNNTSNSRNSLKKKVLEEANNSKLREVEIRVEDCHRRSVANGEEVAAVEHQQPLVTEEVEEATGGGVVVAEDGGDSALDDTSNGSSVQLIVPVTDASSSLEEEVVLCESGGGCGGSSVVDEDARGARRRDSMPAAGSVTGVVEVVSEEDDCVIVAHQARRTTPPSPIVIIAKREERECSSRGDDDGPLSASSPFNRMELSDTASASLRFPDDRSDSGVSSLRSSSGDERSGSRSSALSSTDEPQHTSSSSASSSSSQTNNNQQQRSPLFIPAGGAHFHHHQQQHHLHHQSASALLASGAPPPVTASEPVRVWRDPNLLLESEPHVRHIHSVQHQSLLMSHPSTPAASGPPPTSASAAAAAAAAAAASHPTLYPQVPPASTLMSPHPLHHLPPPGALYPHAMWKPTPYTMPVGAAAAHLLAHGGAHAAEELLERERAIIDHDRHERMIRERHQEFRDLEKHKEKERLERERQERDRQERDKMERERERDKLDREREEKERQEQALHNHFEKSLRQAAQQKFSHLQRDQWNPISAGRPPPSSRPPSNSSSGGHHQDDDRKIRAEQEMHQQQREQRHLSSVRSDARDHRNYYATRSPNVPGKGDYPPPAHSRVPTSKSSEKLSSMHSAHQKSELNVFGYPACQPTFFPHDQPKSKSDHHKSGGQPTGGGGVGLVMTKSMMDNRDVLPNPPPLMSEMKNSVIVKHDGKNSHHLEPRVSMAHSPSPKMRTEMMGSHYLTSPSQQAKSNLYEYRSQTQSPHHHLPHAPSPHHHMELQNLAGKSHHRPSASSAQLASPHHQQQSHAAHAQQVAHPSQEMQQQFRRNSESQAMIYAMSAKGAFPYLPNTTGGYSLAAASSVANSKPKVSSPAPHHIYGKPSAGIVSGVPVSRSHEPSGAVKMGTKLPPLSSSVSPSPYQQVSQYHPPHPQAQLAPSMTCPPPAHSRTPSSSSGDPRYDRMYPGGSAVPGGLSVKVSVQPGTSPPTAASAPLPASRSHPQYSMPGVTLPPAPASQQSQSQSQQNIPSAHSVQTQPLDLGVSNKYESNNHHHHHPQQHHQPSINHHHHHPQQQQNTNNSVLSPKRKGASIAAAISPVCLEVKKRRIEQAPPITVCASGSVTPIPIYSGQGQPQLARVSEPSPLIASAATTITTVVNAAAYRTSHPANVNNNNCSPGPVNLTENLLPDVSVTAVVGCVDNITRPASATSAETCSSSSVLVTHNHHNINVNSPTSSSTTSTTSNNNVVSGPICEEGKSTTTLQPSSVDSDKSNSPGPTKSSSSCYPVRHLKKAWLQRHTGEDLEDTTGVTGSGSCVTLPLNIAMASNNKENPIHSIHSIGSMAVNSISKTKHFASKANNRKTAPSKEATLNGHPPTSATAAPTTNNDANNKGDDSSSSDQDRGRKSPPKRKPPKVKRKKGAGTSSSSSAASKKTSTSSAVEEKKRKTSTPSVVASESGSDSDKESGSEKDSDSGASTTLAPGKKSGGKDSTSGPRKRGRRPKSSKNDKGEEPRPKKSKDDVPPQRDPFRKPPVGQLKKTGESFLQDGPCFEVAPKLAKCRECRWTPNQRSKNMPNIFCRFYAFRRLRYTKNGQLAIAGFSDPHKDALEDDLRLWLPNPEAPPTDLDLETSRFILKQVGDHFCDLFVQEKEAHAEYVSDDKTVSWKRVVQGVREMCDVCETTLFNFHWACGKCGFVVCLDCYKGRKSGSVKHWGEPGKDRDECSWLMCTNRQPHEQDKLMLTQIIAGDSLPQLGKMVHEMRELWNIEQFCACPTSKEVVQKTNNIVHKEIVKKILSESKVNGVKREIKQEEDAKPPNGIAVKDEKTSPLSWLADVALSNEDKKNDENTTSDSDEGSFSTLRELLIRPSHKPNGSRAASPVSGQKNNKKPNNNAKIDTLDEVISSVIEDSVPKVAENATDVKPELKHFLRRYNWQAKGRAPLPIRIMTLTESKMLYPEVPHTWLCDGKLLRLSDPIHKENYKIFQDQWKRGQPVIVSDVTKNLSEDLWTPDSFARDFGDDKNDLVNCMTGNLVPNQPMRKFWEGFDHFSKRLKDDRGNPMLLKLKDWPPGEDFAEMLPSRFSDLMKVLPLSEYTRRSGRLNLASRLPDCFVRPDLGPKMYNAYGSALHPSKGTTNLHLDISDAVNVMVYVGIPKDGDSDEHIKEAFRAIDEAGCDILTRRRVRDKGELPGALWHIYNARDADKIRDLLNKVVVEKGGRLEPHNDPIHDQSCYLDGPLRERLYKEYGVEGYAIVQCLGDAVFIPAGAPHQVRNLHNCIKVAEDFVSPENVSHCFHLTQEFRDLSDTHSNHEDKLQIKNIIYHAVKDALSCISAVLDRHIGGCKGEKNIKEERVDGGDETAKSGSGAVAAAAEPPETA